MAYLNGLDSNGVSQEVIDSVERFREEYEDPTDDPNDVGECCMLTFDMAVSQRDAEYIVECLRVLLQQDIIAERMELSLNHDGISDEAIDVFGQFLRETQCHLHGLWLWNLPHQQFGRLLEALQTNRSVKELCIYKLQDHEGASWIADLLRHKIDFTALGLRRCRFPLAQILPLLRGQTNLKSLGFLDCRINSNDLLLFNDPKATRLFVNNILLSPLPTLMELGLNDCGVTLENRPLMAGFHKNTTFVELFWSPHHAATRLFIDPIFRRNRYLGHIHDMLGTRVTTLPLAGVGEIVEPTIPPPCGLWATVMAGVGQGSQGATPVFTILRDRLATWIIPPSSPRYESQNGLEQQDMMALPLLPDPARPNIDDSAVVLHDSSLDDGGLLNAPLVEKEMLNSVTSPVPAADGIERFQSGVFDSRNGVMIAKPATTTTTTTSATTGDSPSSTSATGTEAHQSLLHQKRAASTMIDKNMVTSKKPKSDML